MASKDYTLNWSDDSLKPPFVLYHTTIDKSTTSLDLTGKDSALWGECIQEDLLRLLENFASHGTPPRAPTIGQFWYNADTGILGIWNGTTWFPVYTPVPAPVWITPESISYTSGSPFTFQASNTLTYNVISGSIPGATFTNGVLTGTATAGNYTLTVRATGAGGFSDRTFNVVVNAAITSTTSTSTTTTPFPTSSTTTTTPFPTSSTTTTTNGPGTTSTTTTTSSSPGTTATTTTTTAAPSVGVDYPTTAIEDEEFTWKILNGSNSVSYYITGATWIAGGRIPASGSLPTINGSTTTLVNGGISTYFTPYNHTITTPGTYNLTFNFSNGQTVSKSVTVTAVVCVDEYTYTMEARYIKSVVRYAGGTLDQNGLLVDEALQNLASQINNMYLSIVGRPGEMAGILHYYGMYESECASRGIPYTPSGTVDATIMSDVIRPMIVAAYNNYEAGLGKINYVGKYCAAKSAGII